MPIKPSTTLTMVLGTSLAVADLVVGFGMLSTVAALAAPMAMKVFDKSQEMLPGAAESLITEVVTDKLPDLVVARLRNEGQGLEAAFASAFEKAITNIERSWVKGSQAQTFKANRRESYDNCKGVFDTLRDHARAIRLDTSHRVANIHAEIFSVLRDQRETPQGMFNLALDELVAERDQHFQHLIKVKLLPECQKCFSELLNSNFELGVKAQSLYVRSMLDSFADVLREIPNLLHEQAKTLNTVGQQQELILANGEDLQAQIKYMTRILEQGDVRGNDDIVKVVLLESIVAQQEKTIEADQRHFAHMTKLLERINAAVDQRPTISTNPSDTGVVPAVDPRDAAVHQGGLLALQARRAYAPSWPPTAGLPVDLGTAWGLNRGTSVNILLSGDEHQIVQHLAKVERDLQPRLRAGLSNLYLLPRLWYEIDVTPGMPLPNTTAEFWKLLSTLEDGQREREARWIEDGQVNPGLVLNVQFVPGAAIDADRVSAYLAAWSAALLRDLFGKSQLALIIRLPNAPLPSVLRVSSRLTERLTAVDIGSAYDPMTLIEYTRDETVPTTLSVMDFFNIGGGADSSDAILSWIHEALPAMRQSARADIERFTRLTTVLGKIVANTNTEHPILRPASTVAHELVSLAPDAIEHFLEFVHHYLPGRLAELIDAMAADAEPTIAIECLRLAIGRNDLVDAWVTGVTRRTDSVVQAVEDVKAGGGAALAEAVAFGFLRKGTLEGRSMVFQHSLNQLRTMVPGATLKVIDYYTATAANPFQLDVVAMEKAAQAELLPDTVLGMLLDSDLDTPLPWWILLASPPTETLLNHLIRRSSKKRAVFGLCSVEESAAVVEDGVLRIEIDASRNRTGAARLAAQA